MSWRYAQRVAQVVALGHTCKDLGPSCANYMSTFSPYHRVDCDIGYTFPFGTCFPGMETASNKFHKSNFNDEKISTIANPPSITPLSDFDWRTTEPLRLRPFKPVYHMTMGTKLPLDSSTHSF
ncbi:hypothetical protein BofuT4_P161100.1 [Botrytis cinerea T4]|uniref:Uncharacterized protein n=1 Tax=Botryotinia fuckeliana (strain T4) TaxID=999810 RepID=G2YTR1_BOTF4|nr:hypothetical protein BofuT4_P161100.1 [Botrytis cinerea T4]